MRAGRAWAASLAAALAIGTASAREADRKGLPHGPGWADPGDVLSAEIGFARLAREKGQWTAFRATAARDAQQFAPGPVRAAEFLKGRKDPPAAMQWQPHAVWMACDGSFAVTRGAWQEGSRAGWFITVWQRQERGDYKWVLDQGGDLATPAPAPEFIAARVAECEPRRPSDDAAAKPGAPARRNAAEASPGDWLTGRSADGTLAWSTRFAPDGMRTGAREFTVRLRSDGAMVEVARAEVAGG